MVATWVAFTRSYFQTLLVSGAEGLIHREHSDSHSDSVDQAHAHWPPEEGRDGRPVHLLSAAWELLLQFGRR